MIIQKSKTKLENPYLICGWPSIGMLGYYIVNYIVSELKPDIFAEIDYEEYTIPHNAIVENGIIYSLPQIQNKIYYLKTQKHDFLFLVGDIEPSLYNMQKLAKDVVVFLQHLNLEMIITFASIPSNILHTDEPKIYIAKTSSEIQLPTKIENLKKLNFGIIEGMNGVLLTTAKEFDINGVCFLSEIPFYTMDMINPQAAEKILNILNQIFSLNIKLDKVKQDIIFMDERIKTTFTNLNEKAQMLFSQIQDFNKTYNKKYSSSSGITFEELKKRIKFSLPESAKNKINELFKLASENIEYARQLKQELDRWGVYKEYEDRFLSLFLKNKKKGKEK
jgi:predicted ATP-grasp superfamily ATP-dependent carboligase